jgi:CNT family concentrative nucleoside transporter
MSNYTGALGIVALPAIAYVLSLDRRRVRWRPVIGGLLLQILFALLVLRTSVGRGAFEILGHIVTGVIDCTDQGSNFLFGRLGVGDEKLFAFSVLPVIIFFASLMSVLYYLGIIQLVVRAMARVMTAAMGVSGAESLSVAANVFVGQTEAPLVVRPYISGMTQSELMALMTGGFATVAGSVLGIYIKMVGVQYATHFLAASVMSAPAAFVIAKIMLPETAEPLTAGSVKVHYERKSVNVIDAATSGAGDGLKLALNVGAMLLAFIALLALIDWPLRLISNHWQLEQYLGGQTLSIRVILGYLFWPIAWVLGVPTQDCGVVGGLLGTKIAATEMVAYLSLHEAIAAGRLTPKSIVICTYALCGFANFASIAIQIGGIGPLAPDRKHDLARLGLRAMIGGALASFMTAAIAGLLVAPDTGAG